MKKIARLDVRAEEMSFVLRIEDESGEAHEYEVSPEQLDAVIDDLDDMLSDHEEEAFEVDDGRTYQKPLG